MDYVINFFHATPPSLYKVKEEEDLLKRRIQSKMDKQAAAPEGDSGSNTNNSIVHGDILEAILSQVPLIDLASACYVSRSWNRAVFSSLRRINKIKPWLLLHTQSQRTMAPYLTTAHAYDARSHVWIEIKNNQPSSFDFLLRSSHSTLLYTLSPSKLSFSFDPLHLAWHHVDAPRVWRTDPVVALVGDKVVVAGGACDFEDDPLAVEMYSVDTRAWEICQSMPAVLKDSAASTWLSVAVNSRQLYVTEKYSGITVSFDPSTKGWSGPFHLRQFDHDEKVFYSATTFANDRLIAVGLTREAEDVKSLKIWQVNIKGGSLEELKEIGEMPKALLEKLKGNKEICSGSGSASLTSVSVTSMGDSVYLHNPSNSEDLVLCEIGECGDDECKWSEIKNVVVDEEDAKIKGRLILTCSSVGIGDLQRALLHENPRSVYFKQIQ